MEWISNWIQGIIVAVIIGTIIEMILPQGNSKKYIKVVIGVYILFSIVSPAITKITGDNLEITDILDIEQYAKASSSDTYQNLDENQNNQIRIIYESSLKSDMKEKIQAKGYEVVEITLGIKNNEEYTLETISLILKKQEKQESEKNTNTTNTINAVNQIQEVNEITIQVGNEQKNNNTQSVQENQQQKNTSNENISISDKEKKELKEYLSSIYQITEENININ